MALSGFRALCISAILPITSLQSGQLLRSLSSSTAATSGESSGAMAVKKVTLSNFCSVLENLRIRIREADFVAVDLEMTGVTSAPWRDSFEFDRSDVRYLKVKDSAEKFAVIQFGLCTFRWDDCQGSFIAQPLNFYIFPRKEPSGEGPTNEFLCQTTSMSFLAKYQFDFNACVHEGISYLSKAQEAEALQKLCSGYENGLLNLSGNFEESAEIPAVRTADVLFTERMKIRFCEWRENVLKYPEDPILEGNHCSFNMDFQMVFFKMRPAIMLNGFTSHRLRLIQLVLRKHFKDLLYLCVSGENCSSQKLVVFTDSEVDRASLMREVKEDKLRSGKVRIRSAVGFRHVIDLLSSEEKLIVGHNCFLVDEFALSVNKVLPHIIDTKHLISCSPVIQLLMKKKKKSLSSAFSLLCPQFSSSSQNSFGRSFVKIDVQSDELGFSSCNSASKHEAGFDAFMTGCVFAQACSHLGIKFEQGTIINLVENNILKSYINILYPSWNSGTVINLRTGAESPVSCYKRKYPNINFTSIAIIWGFSSMLKPKDLEECLCRVFGTASVIYVFFLDRTAALIQFNKSELVNDFLVLKDMLEKDDGPIPVLHPLVNLLAGGNTRAADYNTYRDICSSSASKILFAEQAETIGIRWKTKIRHACEETVELNGIKDSASKERSNDNDSKVQSLQFSFEEMMNSL
ncbi:poly(A)-specific ribonuclease PARN isoform X2 [Phalaenopsis equestris]|uniref:poly(A)-specific ribonuclease PARN isoform X2 n=1 Tax=Phalaenopsis equestris TaxID=78828 RepID=UPI0009E44650|nr:poly(A)-specific ribonuclease PARN isoform X2 [Phalaenopsis equestris]